jgi:putative transposase
VKRLARSDESTCTTHKRSLHPLLHTATTRPGAKLDGSGSPKECDVERPGDQPQALMPALSELGLQLRNKNPKRKVAAKLREDRMMASAPNECWTMDFMVDQLFNGRKLRLLTIVRHMQQTVSGDRRCSRLQGTRCRRNLGSSAREHGRPRRIRVDNGPEFVSRDLDLWAWQHGVVLAYSRPGKPTDNALAEGFNSHVRQECLNAFWFLSLDDARCKIEAWRVEYNTIRPHSAIGHVPPSEHAQSLTAACCSQ